MKPILGMMAALFLWAAPAAAHDYVLGDLLIIHPHAGATTAKSLSAAGYFQIVNKGSMADRLTSVTSEAAMAMIHLSQVDDQGIARMEMMPLLEIPPGATVTLEPGALHVMFTDIKAPFVAGSMVPVTLTFEQAGSIMVDFAVDEAEAKHEHGAVPPAN